MREFATEKELDTTTLEEQHRLAMQDLAASIAQACPNVEFNLDAYGNDTKNDYQLRILPGYTDQRTALYLSGEDSMNLELSRFDMTFVALVTQALLLQDNLRKGRSTQGLEINQHEDQKGYANFLEDFDKAIFDKVQEIACFLVVHGDTQQTLEAATWLFNQFLSEAGIQVYELDTPLITRQLLNLLSASIALHRNAPGNIIATYYPDGDFNQGGGFIRLIKDKPVVKSALQWSAEKKGLERNRLQILDSLGMFLEKYWPNVSLGVNIPDNNNNDYDMYIAPKVAKFSPEERSFAFTGEYAADPAFIALLLQGRVIQEEAYRFAECKADGHYYRIETDGLVISSTETYADLIERINPQIIAMVDEVYASEHTKEEIVTKLIDVIMDNFDIDLRELDGEFFGLIADLILTGRKLGVSESILFTEAITNDKGSGFLRFYEAKYPLRTMDGDVIPASWFSHANDAIVAYPQSSYVLASAMGYED